MNKFDEMLKRLQDAPKIQSGCWDETMPEDIWEEFFANKDSYVKVASGLNVDTHRWYEVSTTVIRIMDRLLGINHVSNVFSESMDAEDCGIDITFFEMKEVPSITYAAM